jgi:hypothetical protein
MSGMSDPYMAKHLPPANGAPDRGDHLTFVATRPKPALDEPHAITVSIAWRPPPFGKANEFWVEINGKPLFEPHSDSHRRWGGPEVQRAAEILGRLGDVYATEAALNADREGRS